MGDVEVVPGFEHVVRVRADNPGMLTLSGTNTWVLGRDPAWVVDPGPAFDAHLDAVARVVAERGGAGGIALTHDHADHVEGVAALCSRLGDGVPVAAMRFDGADVRIGDGDEVGPFAVVAVPGHADDHVVFVAGDVCFTGDAVLGEGSVFVSASLGEYLDALRRLRGMGLALICPGHGPPVLDPDAKLDGYISHRLDRERRLVQALADGLRAESDLLDRVWDDAPAVLRPAAAMTLRAHMEKLRAEGRFSEFPVDS